MITVPRYDSPQVEAQGIPNAHVDAPASAEAFGGGASNAGVFQATGQAASETRRVYVEAKGQADDLAVQDALQKTVKLRNTLLLDPNTGAMTKKGKDAFGVVNEYTPQFDEQADKISETLSNPEQKAMYSKLRGQQATDLNTSLQSHIFTESQKYDDEVTNSGVIAQRDDAVLNYQEPGRIAQSLKMQTALLQSRGQRLGLPDDAVKLAVEDSVSKTHAAVVQRMLANDQIDQAEQYFKVNKAGFDATDVTNVEKSLEGSKDVSLSLSVYDHVKNFRLSDGNPDEAKMEDYVRALPDMSDERKQKIEQVVKAKAGEDFRNKTKAEGANDTTFKNSLTEAFKAGVPLEQALKLPSRYANDSYDQLLKENFARDLYSGKGVKTDYRVKNALEDGIDAGTVTLAQIDRAYEVDHSLDGPAWDAMRARYRQTVIDGKTPGMVEANRQVDLLSRKQFGSDRDAIEAFKSEVNSDSWGKSPQEKQKIAQDKLAQDKNSTWRFWTGIPVIGGASVPFTGQPQYQTDEEKRAADSLVLGRFHQDLGVDTVKSIAQGALRTGSKAGPAEAVRDLSKAVGGYDHMRPGTPAYNAIQSLTRHGRVVTGDSVNKALQNVPDGNF